MRCSSVSPSEEILNSHGRIVSFWSGMGPADSLIRGCTRQKSGMVLSDQHCRNYYTVPHRTVLYFAFGKSNWPPLHIPALPAG